MLVKDIDLPRNQWPLGRIFGANPDDDGLVRRLKVKTQSSVLERSVLKLVLLMKCNLLEYDILTPTHVYL